MPSPKLTGKLLTPMENRCTDSAEPMRAIGFIVNPIAGMGGRVGLKGTDDVVDRARQMGASADANRRASEALGMLKQLQRSAIDAAPCCWETCSGEMGETALREAGIRPFSVVYRQQKEARRYAET